MHGKGGKMKKVMGITVGIIMILTMTACGTKSGAVDAEDSGATQIPNPFVTCETMEDAVQLAGFDFAIPETLPEGYSKSVILAIEKQMIEVDYTKDAEQEIYIRKAAGKDDISGDYNDYPQKSTVTIDGIEVTFKGNNDLVNVALWQAGDYSFAIGANNGGLGIESESIRAMIKEMK